MAEVWPTRLRTTGMGSAYGFGGIGKIIGPLGLALIVGSSNMITPKATLDAIAPSFLYFTAWMVLCGWLSCSSVSKPRRRSISAIDEELEQRNTVAASLAWRWRPAVMDAMIDDDTESSPAIWRRCRSRRRVDEIEERRELPTGLSRR